MDKLEYLIRVKKKYTNRINYKKESIIIIYSQRRASCKD